ncbi:DUF4150 domain-containing protein [Limnobaculum zhutongyuii]|uniref:DUF4150 domain-containing protein n=1 Tax=Limnobaculum zhutongyuii TaxID=2498113 RepID=A0A411WLM3_9GAMM|nr:DUF4150 domain-containing protein [Limnobaculum zhutongyuii]QBH97025.1 DUF4150 domain-containing protein [Limnobaculum zhutongyuii]TQS87425.1 DUF4150 domain-containing protein [Limnobaculum zhutongyuii]
MAREVFANGREVSSKKSNAKAVAPPPDVCHTPPPPPPPLVPPKIGIPIPYPNVSQSSTHKKGTKTVKIKKKEVGIKNKSFYKTSNGNQPATSQFKKGILSGTITGKAYITSWSSDVKFEKKNAVRHLDSTRQNVK